MRSRSPIVVLSALAALAACGRRGGGDPNWLTEPTPESHTASWFPLDATSIHGGIVGAQCNDCHGDPSFTSFKQFDCIHCHNGHHADQATVTGWHTGVAGFAFDSAACYGCHPQGRVTTTVDHSPFFPIGVNSVHAVAACVDCHLDPANRLVLGCAGCHPHEQSTVATVHANVTPSGYTTPGGITNGVGYAFDSSLCVRCHADAEPNTLTSHLPLRITAGTTHGGPTYSGACFVCHPTMRTDKPWATDFSQYNLCLGCHDLARYATIHAGNSKYTSNCYTCHPSGSP